MESRGYLLCMRSPLRRQTALLALARSFKPGTPGLGKRLAALPRMIKASLSGEYDGGARLFAMAAAGLYIVSPIDLVPEAFLFVFGLIDDVVVAGWLAGAVLAETERFLEWERRRSTVIPGKVAGH
jgi:uncharacterized membrane protein YkvA (DUF1232 family)